MSEEQNVCKGGPTLIFACSGAADVGEVSDKAARKLSKQGVGAMFCLAGIGGIVSPIMKKTDSASKILTIDGCELDCARHCLQQAGFSEFEHLRVTDVGLEKGSAPANEENVEKVAKKATEILN